MYRHIPKSQLVLAPCVQIKSERVSIVTPKVHLVICCPSYQKAECDLGTVYICVFCPPPVILIPVLTSTTYSLQVINRPHRLRSCQNIACYNNAAPNTLNLILILIADLVILQEMPIAMIRFDQVNLYGPEVFRISSRYIMEAFYPSFKVFNFYPDYLTPCKFGTARY